MSQQSGTDNGAAILAILVLGAIGAVALVAVTIVAFMLLAALFGFAVRYPRQFAHFTVWTLMGVSTLAGTGVLWHYIWLWDTPPLRAGVIAFICFALALWGLLLFVNVTSTKLLPRLVKIAFVLPLGAGFGYWLLYGGGAAYDAIYCSGALAEAKTPYIDGAQWVGLQNHYYEEFGVQGGSILCGEVLDVKKTTLFFSLFGILPLLYLPVGLLHALLEKERRFEWDDLVDLINQATDNSPPPTKRTPVRAAAPIEPVPPKPSYVAPPFGGR